MVSKLFKSMFRHKFISLVSLLMIVMGGYFGYQGLAQDEETIQYATAAVERGTLISSISGSGQVSASDQVDVKSEVSGDVVYLGVKNGQEVRAGQLLAQIDSHNAQKAVRDAETALETAQLELEKLLEPVDELDLLKAENNLIRAKESKQEAEDDLPKTYEDGFNNIANTFLDLPSIMSGLQGILLNSDFSDNQWNIDYYADKVDSYDSRILKYKEKARSNYRITRDNYEQSFDDYKETSRYSDSATIEALIDQTYETTKDIAETVKSIKNFIDFYEDIASQHDLGIPSPVATHQSSLESYTSITNSHLSSLLSIQQTVGNSKKAIIDAERSIEELELSLEDLKAGTDDLDIRAKKIAIQQKEDALLDAQQDLAKYYVRAPFDGLVAEVNVKKGESISSGAVATLITKQKVAEITINEIDTAVVKVGQKATITFDAVEDLTITGEVAEIDTLGTVTQGVVTYDVKIVFDTQDERIKPGMSMSASIITEMKQNVLMVQNSAIKSEGDWQYVEILENGNARRQPIETGLSNDLYTEVISGVEEGAQVVTGQSSISSTAQSSASSGQNNERSPEGMNMIRIMR